MVEIESCCLCPKGCGVNRSAGSLGACGEDSNMRVSLHRLHLWEEPPISGSTGSGTIFFSGCPLNCIYCQNYSISSLGKGEVRSVEEVADMCLEFEHAGALNINMVTPTHFAPQIRRSIDLARSRGLELPIVWNTSGYESVDAINENNGLVDVYLSDMKYFSNDLSFELSGVSDYRDVALKAIEAMLEQVGPARYDEYNGDVRQIKGVIVRHMILPGCVEDSKKVLSALWSEFRDDISYSIMNQYTPVIVDRAESGDGKAIRALKDKSDLARVVTEEEYEEVLDHADELGIEEYFWQDGETCIKSFIPDF